MSAERWTWSTLSRGPADTWAWGERAAHHVQPGDLLLLTGPVGAGKSVWASGLLAGLEAPGPYPSPTFTLVRTYRGRLAAAHLDLYRLGSGAAQEDLGWEELLDGQRVVVVEWAGYLGSRWPADGLWVDLAPRGQRSHRQLRWTALGPRGARLLAAVAAAGAAPSQAAPATAPPHPGASRWVLPLRAAARSDPGPVLGLDACTGVAGVGLWPGRAAEPATGRGAGPGEGWDRPAATLMAVVEQLLEEAALPLERLAGIAVGLGPGSYAGVRAAVASAKALAWACGIPLVGVGSLRALALAAARNGPVAVALDARHGRVYGALYRMDDGAGLPQELVAPALLSAQAWREQRAIWEARHGAWGWVQAAAAEPTAAGGGAQWQRGPAAIAAAVAVLGARLLAEGEVADPMALQPQYGSAPQLGPLPRPLLAGVAGQDAGLAAGTPLEPAP